MKYKQSITSRIPKTYIEVELVDSKPTFETNTLTKNIPKFCA